MIQGQINLYDAIRRQVDFKSGEKEYKLRTDKPLPTLICRTRGWHLNEDHFQVDGQSLSGALFDFGLYFFHNAKELVAQGRGPYFYLPKMESHLEARLWNDVFNAAQDFIGMSRGTIRGTVLIETITAVFEMDEVSPISILISGDVYTADNSGQIIYELRDHIGGLNCGRWDYIFTFVKIFRNRPDMILPDRADVTMTVPFMESYVKLLISTCHRRGVHAMGGMAAVIPIKNDEAANARAMESVRADKLREVLAGHDGTWVAHPALAKLAMDVFDEHMPTANQIHVCTPYHAQVTAGDLLNPNVPGKITLEGVRKNIHISLVYSEAWLRGIGCSPINFLMVRFYLAADRVKYYMLRKVYRRMQPRQKCPAASSGSGCATGSARPRASGSPRTMCCRCWRSRPGTWRRRRPRATSSARRPSTSPSRLRARTIPIS